MGSPAAWPHSRKFAFTVFDDPDSQTFAASREVYGLLGDLGILTTKGVWPLPGDPRNASDHGETCGNPAYAAWLREIQEQGFEIGYHNATSHTSRRETTLEALDRFAELFGQNPVTMSNHYHCHEGIYWGPNRLSGWRRHAYNVLTLGRNRGRSLGHLSDSPYFWGDLCQQRIRYVRNFASPEINTLRACPRMPYHDPQRPFVNYWYSSSEGAKIDSFLERLSEARQDRLEAEGGACIMYVHFGHGFYNTGGLHARFRELMRRLSRKNGWFVPVGVLLDYLREQQPRPPITDRERAELERRWLWHKVRYGTS